MEPIRGVKHLPGSPECGLVPGCWGGQVGGGWWGVAGGRRGRPWGALQLYQPDAPTALSSASPQPSPARPSAFDPLCCLSEPTATHFWVLL